MATQTGSIDMAAMAEAAKTANNYITNVTNAGIRVHPADDTDNYAAIDANGMSVVRDSESVAHFGESTRIGVEDGNHALLDSDSFDIYHDDVEMVHFGYGEGTAQSGTADAPYYTLGTRASNSTVGNYSTAQGYGTTASGYASHTEGYGTTASGMNAHAEGSFNHATGNASHTEGDDTTASGNYSHAEGSETTASSAACHAEGTNTTASGGSAHAEGVGTQATGNFSHAQNFGTVAAYDAQTAIGRLNVNSSTNAFEIGNGTDGPGGGTRSNAFAVDWDGYLYPMNEQMPDWVVAQGTSGIWTYRKWHSGIAECWGTYTASIAVNIASASYGGYRSDQITATAWPTGTFVAAPTVTATVQSGGGTWVNNVAGSDASAAKFFLSCGASMAAANRSVAIHAIGRWK